MNLLFAKAAILMGTILLVIIPACLHGRGVKVVKSRKGLLETVLLAFTSIGFLTTLLWLVTPALAFADYSLRPIPFAAGMTCIALGLWLFFRSHAELGTNWSITLELREHHQLVTKGIYSHVRHPMYLALLLYAAGQALVLSNWVAGPFYLAAVVLLFAFRFGPEERMMLEEFGKVYEAYAARTKRLVPGIW